ncbi:MAG TPA: O-antigen ligase family protein [Stellaceae bacterium]|nr:O-antigen ligase family protein [Stellaceae bacterium]
MGAGSLSGAERGRILDYLPVAVFAALPTLGLFAGPSYSPLVFGLGVVGLVVAAAMGKALPRLDRGLLVFALLFAGFCWASALWSIAPRASRHGALQLTAIFAAALVVLGARPLSPRACDLLFRATAVAFAVGAAVIGIDAATGYHLQLLFATDTADIPTKYNRGADYLVLIAWPLLARAAVRREWAMFAAVLLSTGLALAIAPSATGRIAALVGLCVLLVAFASCRIVAGGLAAASALIAAATPFLLRALAQDRAAIAARLLVTPHLRISGLARLEIWDYMTARVFERPLLGWGLWSAKFVPIGANEMGRYLYAGLQGNYPHNEWLQLWVETGAFGAAVALAFALFVLRRIHRSLSPSFRPFAYAAFACAMTISLSNYEITTDSWWAALVACAYLFIALRAQASFGAHRGPVRIREGVDLTGPTRDVAPEAETGREIER